VVKPELFFDRKKELEDAYVTCEQILNGGVGGILVIGGKGIGKTSFIDALIRVLNEKKIGCAKITLTESMVKPEAELAFVQLILTELLNVSRKSGLLEEDFVDKVTSMLRGLKVEGELDISLPGMSFIAKAFRENLTPFPSIALRDGLADYMNLIDKKGRKDARKGAILLFDEGTCLTNNKDLMQIFKNVFQNTPGIGVVIAGSNQLLGQVSDVFSPLPRGFMKIELGPYPDESAAYESIRKPLDITRQLLLAEKYELDVIHRQFDKIVISTTGRMPLEINLLCHFAFDIGAQNVRVEGRKVTLYLRFDKNLLDVAYKQLVGTRGYSDLLRDLEENEISFLRILSKSSEKATLQEMTLMLELDLCRNSLQEMPIANVASIIENCEKHLPNISDIATSITEKGDKYKINVLGTSIIGQPMYDVDDQFVRSYFKYGWREEDVDIELGIKPRFDGIKVFGDPIATTVHSTFFPRVCDYTGKEATQPFRAHVGPNSGQWLRPQRNCQLLVASYIRLANNSLGHYAINLERTFDAKQLEIEFKTILDRLKTIELIDKPETLIISGAAQN
jgi:hypothetical protein